MLNRSFISIITLLFTALLMSACGGDGNGGTGGTNTGTGGGGTGGTTSTPLSTIGVITGFGSIFINGVQYELENGTVVAVEDEADVLGDDSRLRLGMKVRMRARIENNQRIAERIEFDEDLKGIVRDIVPDVLDPSIGTFRVQRILVIVDANTVFDDDVGDNDNDGTIDIKDLSDPPDDVVVEVSGHIIDGGILATRVDRINPPGTTIDENEVEVKGRITDISGLPTSFELNAELTVNVNGTTFDEGLTGVNDLTLNLFVEVKGTRVSDTEINASEIELEDRLGTDERDGQFEIEGILQSVNTAGNPHIIVINGITLRLQDASNLTPWVGRRIELRGTFNGDLLVPSTDRPLNIEVENSIRTRDLLRSVDINTDTLTTRLGLQITPTGLSRVEDDTRDVATDILRLDDFISGLQGKGTDSGVPVGVEARGFPTDSGVVWTRVEIDPVEGGVVCRLRGPVESINATEFSFVIQGVTVDASGASDYLDSRPEITDVIDRTEFFARLEVGMAVAAAGNKEEAVDTTDCTDLSLIADEVRMRFNDDIFGTAPPDEVEGGGDVNLDDEISGTANNINNDLLTFHVSGVVITVNNDTLIDNSIIESVLGGDVLNDLPFGDVVGASLADLLAERIVRVRVSVSGETVLALSIEDL
jgi:hypothetical protein